MTWFWDRLFEGEFASYREIEDIYNSIMSLLCVICAGIAAGLTMGLLSLDITKMELKSMTGKDWEKEAAQSILPIIKQHHLLLVTLLLFNSMANEALPVFLGAIVPNYVAVILSVTLVLIFGEILPSAVFTGPNQLYIAAKMTPVVYFLIAVLWPIAFPISWLLDYAFGKDEASVSISRAEFEALVKMQSMQFNTANNESSNEKLEDLSNDDDLLTVDEVTIMSGILNLSRLSVTEVMIPIGQVFMLSDNLRLGSKELYSILNSGYSRIPIYHGDDRGNIQGYVLVKTLIVINPSDFTSIKKLPIREPIFIRPNMGLLDILSLFRTGRAHLGFVSLDPMVALRCMREQKRPPPEASVLGIVTLEDVIEKIIQDDILDETDILYNVGTQNGSSMIVHQGFSHSNHRRHSVASLSSLGSLSSADLSRVRTGRSPSGGVRHRSNSASMLTSTVTSISPFTQDQSTLNPFFAAGSSQQDIIVGTNSLLGSNPNSSNNLSKEFGDIEMVAENDSLLPSSSLTRKGYLSIS